VIVADAVDVIELQGQRRSKPLGDSAAAAPVRQTPLAHESQFETVAIVIQTILDENLA
jgi:hypothetical protein